MVAPPSLQFLWDKFHPEILMESPDTNNVDKLQTENDWGELYRFSGKQTGHSASDSE